jgi:hypothetical protein
LSSRYTPPPGATHVSCQYAEPKDGLRMPSLL